MAAPTSKQLDRASQIKQFIEQLDSGFTGLAGIATRASKDDVTLAGADLSGSSLAYVGDASIFDAAVAMVPQLLAALDATTVTGTNLTISQVVARICGS
jgi:hypothetical protein